MIHLVYTKGAEIRRRDLQLSDLEIFRRTKKHYQQSENTVAGMLGLKTHLHYVKYKSYIVNKGDDMYYIWDGVYDGDWTRRINSAKSSCQDLPPGRIVTIEYDLNNLTVKVKEEMDLI